MKQIAKKKMYQLIQFSIVKKFSNEIFLTIRFFLSIKHTRIAIVLRKSVLPWFEWNWN